MDPSVSIRKPLRARKTMTPSSRKQVEMLSRMKGVCEPGRTASGGPSSDRPGCLAVAQTNGSNHNSPKELNVRLSPPPAFNKPGTNSGVGSEIGICGGPREAAKELPKSPSNTNSDMKQFLSAGTLQDLLYQWYEKESCPPPSKPVEVHLDLVPASCLLDRSKEPRFPLAAAASHGKERDKKEPPLGDPARVVSEQENCRSHSPQEAADSSVLPDEAWRRRRMLASNESVPCKHLKTSDGAGQDCSASPESRQDGLGKIKSFIQERLDAVAGDLSRNLQLLNQRIDRTQCLRKHEGIAIKIVKRISKLDRRVNAMIAAQKAELSKKAKLPGSDAPDEILNGNTSLPGNAKHQPVPSTKTTSVGSKVPPPAAESSEDVICLDAKKKRPGVQTAQAPGVRQNGASVDACASARTLDSRKNKLVIDLTEDGSNTHQEEEKKASGKAKLAPESLQSDPPQRALLSPKEVPRQFPHLPPLPRIHLLPELLSDFKGTLPPQKLELAIVRILNPKGIALQWNISKVDARCAVLESFHLFFFVDNASVGTPFSWTRTQVIKALPLPMIITLSQLPVSGTYYFTMQSKDIYGRYGPFCDIQAVSVS